MANQRLQHDAAVAIATVCLDVVFLCLPPALRRQAWESFYQTARWGIEAYEIQVDRMQQRLHPSKN
ncbi:MAG: hypothetical protein ACYC3I_26980 [Gemmataceae bacterium]